MDFSLNASPEYFDFQYERWKANHQSVSREWQLFFAGFDFGSLGEYGASGICNKEQILLQCRVDRLIHRYRDLGHLLSCLDPLVACPTSHPLLSLEALGLLDADLDRSFFVPTSFPSEEMRLRDIIGFLKETYCGSIGVEYLHMQDPGEQDWLQERIEKANLKTSLTDSERLHIAGKLLQATLFDQFLHVKYPGQKRFSLEGAEVIIALLDALVRYESEHGCREIIIGMAHRGRLNVQANVLNKPYEEIFCHFAESYDPDSLTGSGDVKYHLGYLSDVRTADERLVRLFMPANASHLESVDPVVQGIARARQDMLKDRERKLVLPVSLHGDAAFAGQGVVAETLNLSRLEGYTTGGTIHIIINNQIGFTTLPEDARSTRYSTDVAKMLMVPIFHVHGEDPEAAVSVVKLASDYRRAFQKDVVIDVVCYRRYGHSEVDEPYYTQPQMYERIKNRPPVSRIYAEQLLQRKVLSESELAKMEADIMLCLETAFRSEQAKTCPAPASRYFEEWNALTQNSPAISEETGCSEDHLIYIAEKASTVPEGFTLHPRLAKILEKRLETVKAGKEIDWATAEMLAIGSLLLEGVPVRLSGEDCRRGTFSQRHSVLVDVKDGRHFTPLNNLSDNQAEFNVFDSMLSENAILGFEYGYSITNPWVLVIWEAQFGDFANNAQVIIDQYIAAGEAKWGRGCGLVVMLPHGFEGQGPEHSSARIERYLQLCAENNLRVCYPTTPAQFFHLLRLQAKRFRRKPLIVMTPKSLLRHPRAVSDISEMSSGSFLEILDDPETSNSPERVLMCSGKIYYELIEQKHKRGIDKTMIWRLEQLYPFPERLLVKMVGRCGDVDQWIWVQEEPENMGAWMFVRNRLEQIIGKAIKYVGRRAAASPATGYYGVHKMEQAAILEEAFPG